MIVPIVVSVSVAISIVMSIAIAVNLPSCREMASAPHKKIRYKKYDDYDDDDDDDIRDTKHTKGRSKTNVVKRKKVDDIPEGEGGNFWKASNQQPSDHETRRNGYQLAYPTQKPQEEISNFHGERNDNFPDGCSFEELSFDSVSLTSILSVSTTASSVSSVSGAGRVKECSKCHVEKAMVTLRPCRHRHVCRECVESVLRANGNVCPHCAEPVKYYKRVI